MRGEPPTVVPPAWSIRDQGDRCLSIDLRAPFDDATANACHRIADALRGAGLPGVTDIVPSFTSVALLFGRGIPDPRAHQEMLVRLPRRIDAAIQAHASPHREVQIPVCYGGVHGPDLEAVARQAGVTPDELVRRHCLPGPTVIMLGFAPGQPYIGLHDPVFQVPRRTAPRTHVPAGSVAIANRQSAIYANDSPGGWHLIGRTPVRLFAARSDPPALLQPGDRILFRAIGEAEFTRLATLESEAGAQAGAA
jgi:inhibitor of KinA